MSYVFDANTDPNERTRRRRLAEALMLKATDAGPIASPWQGAAKMAQALIGGIELGQYDKQDREDRDYQKGLTAELSGGGAAQPQAPSSVAAALANPGRAPSFVASGGKMTQAPADLAPYFDEASKMTGIPAPVLMAKVRQESSFNPNAIGKAGEVGLTQIMPSTARDPGFGMQGVDPASLRDPRANIMFGAQYLAARGKAAGVTDWTDRNQVAKALTAYNGGGDPNYASNVMRFLPGGPVSPATAALAGGGGQPQMAGGDTLAPSAPQAPAAQPSGMMGLGGNISPQRLMQIAFDPRATPMQQKQAQFLLQQTIKDPKAALEMQDLQIRIAKGQKELGQTEMERVEGKDGQIYERRKGTQDPWSPTLKTNAPPPDAVRKLEEVGITKEEQGRILRDPKDPLNPFITKALGGSGVTVNNAVTTGGGSDKQVFDAIEADAKEARSAVSGLQAIQDARKAISGGGIFGAGADARLGLQKVGALLGVTDPKTIQNTETFRAAIAPQVSAVLKATVGTSQISNTDREFAEKAAGGSITLDEGSVKRLLDIMEKASRGRVSAYQKRLDTVYPDSPEGKFARERALFGLTGIPEPMPEPDPQQSGQPPVRKSVGGKTYEKRADGWYAVN